MIEINNTNIDINVLKNTPNIKKKPIKINDNLLKKYLNMVNDSYNIYLHENPIEWTPVKLCQAIYYLLRMQDEFWLVKYTNYNGLEYFYVCSIQDLLISRINYLINFDTRSPEYLINMYVHYLKHNVNGAYYYLCTTNDNNYKYDNYIIRWNNKIEYVQLVY